MQKWFIWEECMEVLIRAAQADDLTIITDNVVAVALEAQEMRLRPEVVARAVRTLFERPELGFYLVAESRGEIVGSLLVSFEWSDWQNGVYWWLQSVYVRPDHRRRGVFRQLYETVRERAATDPGVVGLNLYVHKNNKTARNTYRSVGMKATDSLIYCTPDLKKK